MTHTSKINDLRSSLNFEEMLQNFLGIFKFLDIQIILVLITTKIAVAHSTFMEHDEEREI